MPEENNQITYEKQSSGGVKTPEGKAISRYNAQKHAILRETITEYEKASAEQIYNDLSEAIEPRNRLEELLVETIGSNFIRLLRIVKAETELVKETLKPSGVNLHFGGYKTIFGYGSVEKLELYSRYQTATENRIHRTIALIRDLQRNEQSQKN